MRVVQLLENYAQSTADLFAWPEEALVRSVRAEYFKKGNHEMALPKKAGKTPC